MTSTAFPPTWVHKSHKSITSTEKFVMSLTYSILLWFPEKMLHINKCEPNKVGNGHTVHSKWHITIPYFNHIDLFWLISRCFFSKSLQLKSIFWYLGATSIGFALKTDLQALIYILNCLKKCKALYSFVEKVMC